MLRAVFLPQRLVESPVFPPRHRILVRRLMLRFELLMAGLVLGVQILMGLLVLALIRIVREHERWNSEQARQRNGKDYVSEMLFHRDLLFIQTHWCRGATFVPRREQTQGEDARQHVGEEQLHSMYNRKK